MIHSEPLIKIRMMSNVKKNGSKFQRPSALLFKRKKQMDCTISCVIAHNAKERNKGRSLKIRIAATPNAIHVSNSDKKKPST